MKPLDILHVRRGRRGRRRPVPRCTMCSAGGSAGASYHSSSSVMHHGGCRRLSRAVRWFEWLARRHSSPDGSTPAFWTRVTTLPPVRAERRLASSVPSGPPGNTNSSKPPLPRQCRQGCGGDVRPQLRHTHAEDFGRRCELDRELRAASAEHKRSVAASADALASPSGFSPWRRKPPRARALRSTPGPPASSTASRRGLAGALTGTPGAREDAVGTARAPSRLLWRPRRPCSRARGRWSPGPRG